MCCYKPRQEGLHDDQKRQTNDRSIRIGAKKAQPVSISHVPAEKLMAQPATPLGRRDALLLFLLLEEGLRIGEVVLLKAGDFDLDHGELHFYRPKVDREQRLKISEKTVVTARTYLENDAPIERDDLARRRQRPGWKSSRLGRLAERPWNERTDTDEASGAARRTDRAEGIVSP